MADQHLGEAKYFKFGAVVALKYQVQFGEGVKYGHVVGFSLNAQNEILISVQLPTHEEGVYKVSPYHPSNLTII